MPNGPIGRLRTNEKVQILVKLESINSVLDALDMEPSEPDLMVEELIKEREAARNEKDWAAADHLRQELKEMGIELIYTRDGPLWHKVES